MLNPWELTVVLYLHQWHCQCSERGTPCSTQPDKHRGEAAPATQQAWTKGNSSQHHSCVREDPDRKRNVLMFLSLVNWLYGCMENWRLIELVCLGFHFSYLKKDGAVGFPTPARDDIAAELHHSAQAQFAVPLIHTQQLGTQLQAARAQQHQLRWLIISSSCCETLPGIPSALPSLSWGWAQAAPLGPPKTAGLLFLCVFNKWVRQTWKAC